VASVEVLTEVFFEQRQIFIHRMVSDAVGTWRERITGEAAEAVCQFAYHRHCFVELPIRVEVHHGVDVVEDGLGWYLRDYVIVIDEAEVSRFEGCVVGFR
jgi:hypothetical protein